MRIQLSITKSGCAHFTVAKAGSKKAKYSYDLEEAKTKLHMRCESIVLRWLSRNVICMATGKASDDPNPNINDAAQILVEDAMNPMHTYGYIVFNKL